MDLPGPDTQVALLLILGGVWALIIFWALAVFRAAGRRNYPPPPPRDNHEKR